MPCRRYGKAFQFDNAEPSTLLGRKSDMPANRQASTQAGLPHPSSRGTSSWAFEITRAPLAEIRLDTVASRDRNNPLQQKSVHSRPTSPARFGESGLCARPTGWILATCKSEDLGHS